MVVELISVGTEILLGNITNTNARYLSEECAVLGFSVYHQTVVGDNAERLSSVVAQAMDRADIILITGGLGPTEDDLTRETVASLLHKPLVEDKKVKDSIQKYFDHMDLTQVPENNWRQAQVIEGACVLENDNGTAPGMITETEEGKKIILLPGPPNEMIPLFEEKVVPYLLSQDSKTIMSKTIKVCGIGESKTAEMLADLIANQTNPTIATYAKNGEVHIRVTASEDDLKSAKKIIKPVIKQIKNILGNHIYTLRDDETLEQHVIGLIKRKKMTVTTAESCTGGMLASTLINVSGASEVLGEAYITYSDSAKHKLLGVKKKTLNTVGAVSRECAEEMVKGAAKSAKASIALSTTGIAGPDGGTEEHPVGLVYIGCYIDGKVWVQEKHFNGNRQKVRELAVKSALDLLRRCIEETSV